MLFSYEIIAFFAFLFIAVLTKILFSLLKYCFLAKIVFLSYEDLNLGFVPGKK